MKTKTTDNVKLGLFVLSGIAFLIFTLYMIGKSRNLFGRTFTIKASVGTVNGLMPGDNVRFKGIDVGTVKEIKFAGDTALFVVMIIDEKLKPYIRQDAVASIGTDGLMGNKLVNISSLSTKAPPVQEGSVIQSREPVETDEMLRTLNTTNNTIERVTRNLDEITVKLNSSNSLWNLISDTVITQDLRDAVKNLKVAGANTVKLTASAHQIVDRLGEGEGLVSTLFVDTTLSKRLDNSIDNLQIASEKTTEIMIDLTSVIHGMKTGQGTAGLLLTDTLMRRTLMESALHVEEGTARFNENMEALRTHFLFRKYFRKMEKEDQKKQKQNNSAQYDSTALTKTK